MNQENTNDIINIKLAKFVQPQPTELERISGKMILWGNHNDYPNYLTYLFNNSPIHKSICNAKSYFIEGNGLEGTSDQSKLFIERCNPSYGLNELRNRIILDYILFNGFAIEVIYNKLGEPIQLNHIPFSQLRTNRSKSEFYFNPEWKFGSRQWLTYQYWKPSKLINPSEFSTRIFYYSEYSPPYTVTSAYSKTDFSGLGSCMGVAGQVYPLPEYNSAIKPVEITIKCNEYNLNNVSNNFTPTKWISLYKGKPTPEVASDIKRDLADTSTGVDGDKFKIEFLSPNEKPAEIQTLGNDNTDKMFELTRKNAIEDTIIAHSLPSKLLIAYETNGSFGGNGSELEIAYQIYKTQHINAYRRSIDSQLFLLLRDMGYSDITLKEDTPLFKLDNQQNKQQFTLEVKEIK